MGGGSHSSPGIKKIKKMKNTGVLSTFLLKPLTPELKRLKMPVF